MSYLDVLYRALVDYRKNTRDDKDCTVQRTAIITANSDSDVIEITRRNCKIELDWVEAIERGLEFIEKAIKEERQFIRSNGEVVPIEKVKRVSKDSVEHLAKHSSLLTREPEEGEDVIPDSLYMVERLSDYAVYENRFLYMLLCYLRDFIGMRYEKIVELTNTYSGKMSMTKTVIESNRRLEYEVHLVEEKKNDEYLKTHNRDQDAIDRVLMIYRAVNYFLNTPLMNEVSKAPMLKPPVTRTNVLRMNRNFREALSLYEYVSAYEGDGYEILVDVKTLSPFASGVAEEIAETVELSSFLTYEHGLGIKDHFKRIYDREEARRKEEEKKRFAEQLKNVRRHLQDGEISPEEYILMLEKRISDLEERENELEIARLTIEELHGELDRCKFDLKHAKETISSLEDEIVALNQKYIEDMEAARIKHAEEMEAERIRHAEELEATIIRHNEEIEELNRVHAEEIDTLNRAHEEEMEEERIRHEQEVQELTDEFNAQVEELNRVHAEEIDALKEFHANQIEILTNEYEGKISVLNDTIEQIKTEFAETIDLKDKIIASERLSHAEAMEKEALRYAEKALECKVMTEKYEKTEQRRAISDARLYALRSEHGLITPNEDFCTKEMTDELEHEYLVFKGFFKGEWKKTKKRIRKEVFSKMKEEEKARQAKK